MKIEVGKIYRDRNGEKVVAESIGGGEPLPVRTRAKGEIRLYTQDGFYIPSRESHPFDIVGLGSPIRTVTRREIVPGKYGLVNITGTYQGNRVTMGFLEENIQTAVSVAGMNASELRETAHLFNQLAEVLEENEGSK